MSEYQTQAQICPKCHDDHGPITCRENELQQENAKLREALENQSIALSNVLYERKCQDAKWGEQNHNPYKWLAILLEEIGEASKDLLENELIKYRDEMVQVAAVALAAIESFDRQALEGGDTPQNPHPYPYDGTNLDGIDIPELPEAPDER